MSTLPASYWGQPRNRLFGFSKETEPVARHCWAGEASEGACKQVYEVCHWLLLYSVDAAFAVPLFLFNAGVDQPLDLLTPMREQRTMDKPKSQRATETVSVWFEIHATLTLKHRPTPNGRKNAGDERMRERPKGAN